MEEMTVEQQRAMALAAARARVAQSGMNPDLPEGIQATLQSPELAPHTFGDKFAMGAGDIPRGAGQLALHGVEAVGANPQKIGLPTAGEFDQRIGKREAMWQANRASNHDTGFELARGLGSTAAAAPVALALPEIGAGTAMGAAATGALQGGIQGALSPVTDTTKGFGGQKALQVGGGMALGGATNLGAYGASKLINPTVDPNVQYLRDRGVQPTIGQNIGPNAAKFEDAISTVNPAVAAGQKRAIQQFNVAAYNEALKPLQVVDGQTVRYTGPPGRQAIKAVGDRLSNAYDEVKPHLSLAVDDDVMSSLSKISDEAAVTTDALSKKYQRFITRDVLARLDDQGVLTGQAFKDAEEALNTRASVYAQSAVGDDRQLAHHLYDAVDALRQHLSDANPEYAPKLQAINQGWAVLARIEKASGMAPAKDNGVFTPNMLSRTVQSSDASVRHRQYLRGEAFLQPLSDAGSQVLGNTYPNSGTFGRYLAGSGILGGAAAVSPGGATALGATSLAYTPWGQRLAGVMLNDRPSWAPTAASLVRRGGVPTVSGLVFGTRARPGAPNERP